jgi:5'-nucleotidase / UDP-sugar diphosphatase
MKRTATLLLSMLAAGAFAGPINLTILHTDDLHGHVEPVKVKNGIYGGYARQATLVKRYVKQDPNPVVLSGGDTFQGTMYFRVYTGMADCFFMNYIGYQGMAVGNHEFDLGPAPLAAFAKAANFPLLAANLDVSAEPLLRDLIKPHAVLTVGKEKIGLVGAVTPDLPTISSPGQNVKLLELMTSLQRSVDALAALGVDKVILLSHLGYGLEQEVAAKVKGIDVIVGGHSHTLLGTFNNPDFPKSEGPYPTVVKNPDGNRTLLLAAWEWGKVLGRIKVDFDAKGAVKAWRDAQPVVVDQSIAEDPIAQSAVLAYQKPIEQARRQVVAQSLNGIDRAGSGTGESPLGDVIADGMLAAGLKSGAQIALMNSGGIRASISPGPLTYDKAVEVQPFGNTLVLLDVTGAELKSALELCVDPPAGGRMLQVSRGFQVVYDLSKPASSRVDSMTLNGQAIEMAKTYRVVLNSFTAAGGDAFLPLKQSQGQRIDTGINDLDATVAYLQANPALDQKIEGRIQVKGGLKTHVP